MALIQINVDTQSLVDQKYFKIHFLKMGYLDFELETKFKLMMKDSMGYTSLEIEESFYCWRNTNSAQIEDIWDSNDIEG
jgi:hypothetical protein